MISMNKKILQSGIVLLVFSIISNSYSHEHVYLEQQNSSNSWTNHLANLDSQDGLIDRQQSLQIGEWALRQLNSSTDILHDPWLQESLQSIVWQLNAVARQDAPLALTIINDKQINAFAVPAGLIGLNIGLIDKARSLDEVASVIAHEIAHVSQRHYQHRNNEKNKLLLMQLGGLLAGIAVASSDGEAGTAVMMGTQAMSANTSASFSRGQEREADRIGMQIMAEAGYDVNAMPSFFALMNQQAQTNSKNFIPSFVLSHPLTAERLSESRQRATNYPKQNKHLQINQDTINHRQQLFDQMQWWGRYVAGLANKTELIQASKTSRGAKLALAMQLIDERQFSQARKALQPFDNEIQNLTNPLAVIVWAKLEHRQGNSQQAIAKLKNLQEILPERRDIRLYLVDMYLAQHQSTDAQTVLRLLQPLSRQNPRDVQVWQRLQQASQILAKSSEGKSKILHEINVLRYRAYVEFWQNDLKTAITSLTQAKKLAESLVQYQQSNTALLAVIQQQIDQIQQANAFKPS